MTDTAVDRGTGGRKGRPRDERIDEQITAAALQVLADVDFFQTRCQPVHQLLDELGQLHRLQDGIGWAGKGEHRFHQLGQPVAILLQALEQPLLGVIFRQAHGHQFQPGADIVDGVAHFMGEDGGKFAQQGALLQLAPASRYFGDTERSITSRRP